MRSRSRRDNHSAIRFARLGQFDVHDGKRNNAYGSVKVADVRKKRLVPRKEPFESVVPSIFRYLSVAVRGLTTAEGPDEVQSTDQHRQGAANNDS